MSFILLGILNSQAAGAGGASYELIESQVLSSSASSVAFSSIPQDYKHLQIRGTARDTRVATNSAIKVRLNSDSGANYAYHALYGDGSSVASYAGTSANEMFLASTPSASQAANIFNAFAIDILDYTASKNSTLRVLSGQPSGVYLESGLWMNTAAVSSVLLSAYVEFVAGSRFSLYGIRG